MRAAGPRDYVPPRYRVAGDDPWFHFLHGNVPGHQIDFMYRPEVPQGPLCRQHYSHLARLMSYIEPRGSAGYAFAIGNLSRDDTQHEPGHGGVALVLGLRVRGAVDHAGRPDPPFAHAIAAVDRALDAPALLEAATSFHRRVLGEAASAEWYRSYVRSAAEDPLSTERVLAGYVATFDDLPRPAPSALSLAWTTGGATPTGRVVFVYPDDAPFEVLARAAARIAAVLYRSDVRWSVISTGREADLPNGLTVRFVPESAVGRGEATAALHALRDLPEDDETLARELFGATPVVPAEPVARVGRDRGVASEAGEVGDGDGNVTLVAAPRVEALADVAAPEPPAPMVPIPVPLSPVVPPPPEPEPTSEPSPGFGRSRAKAALVAACFLAGIGAMFYGLFGQTPDPPAAQVAGGSAQVAPAPPAEDVGPAPAPTSMAASEAPVGVGAPPPSPPSSGPKTPAKPAGRGGRTPARGGRRGDILGGPPRF